MEEMGESLRKSITINSHINREDSLTAMKLKEKGPCYVTVSQQFILSPQRSLDPIAGIAGPCTVAG